MWPPFEANIDPVICSLNAYTSSANLGSPLLGIYITVEEGTATVAVAPTTAVDSMTLPEYTPSSTGSGTAAPTKTGGSIRTSIGHAWPGVALLFLAGLVVLA